MGRAVALLAEEHRWIEPALPRVVDQAVLQAVTRVACGVAESFGATAEVTFERTYPATVSNADATKLAHRAAEAVAGASRVSHMDQPTMGGEDFSFMLNACQGAYIMLGAGRGPGDAMVHHPKYDFNDAVLPIGASYWATLAEQLLPRK